MKTVSERTRTDMRFFLNAYRCVRSARLKTRRWSRAAVAAALLIIALSAFLWPPERFLRGFPPPPPLLQKQVAKPPELRDTAKTATRRDPD